MDKSGSFFAYAIYAPQNAAKLEAAFKEEIEKILKTGVTEDELKSAKSGYLQSRQVSRAQDGALSGTLNTNLYLNRNLAWEADFEKKVASLTPAQIKEALGKYLDISRFVIVKAGDFAKGSGAAAGGPASSGGSPKP